MAFRASTIACILVSVRSKARTRARQHRKPSRSSAWASLPSAEDLDGFLCCLSVCRALDRTEKRMHAIVDARNAIRKARKLLEKQEQDKIECPKFKDYKGQKLTKCLPSGEQCAACDAKFKEMHP